MTRGEVEAAAAAIIKQCNAASAKDFGRVMGMASKQLAGKADGKVIADVIKAMLPA
jgi:uncharacterized protein YqeY